MKCGRLEQIVTEICSACNIPYLPEEIIKIIRQREWRKRTFITSVDGLVSPLLAVEPKVVSIILQMCRIRQSLTPAQGLSLVNSVIHGTQTQKDLIQWKTRYSHTDGDAAVDGQVGYGYWQRFRKRNEDKLVSKRGQKYELDRQSWTTYANFQSMYSHVEDEMVDADVVEKLPEPSWLDMEGNIIDKGESYGCKETHQLIHPVLCIVADDV